MDLVTKVKRLKHNTEIGIVLRTGFIEVSPQPFL